MKKITFSLFLVSLLICLFTSYSFIFKKAPMPVSYISVQGPRSCPAGEEIKLEAIGYNRNLRKIEKGFCPVWKIDDKSISLGEFIPPAGRKVIFKAKSKGICHFLVRQGDITKIDAIIIKECKQNNFLVKKAKIQGGEKTCLRN